MVAVPNGRSRATAERAFLQVVPANRINNCVFSQRGMIYSNGMPNSISQHHAEPLKEKRHVSSMGIYCVCPEDGQRPLEVC